MKFFPASVEWKYQDGRDAKISLFTPGNLNPIASNQETHRPAKCIRDERLCVSTDIILKGFEAQIA
jgi:hypothetical protein